ncbi:MAG: hypothetical protein Q4G70_14355 [Pseudomonadota bacterium]|nr:hypothetical protein [Pseudomonadota bacterium]
MKKTLLAATSMVAVVTLLSACGGGGGSSGTTPGTPTGGTSTQTDTATGIVATDASRTISLTVGKQATINRTDKDLKYTERFQVTVTDTNGLPIKGASISTRVEMSGYSKGYVVWLDDKGSPTGDPSAVKSVLWQVTARCPNEDKNLNNILDPGEDVNGNGMLDPRIAEVASSIEGGTTITNENGVAFVLASYDIGAATWVDYNMYVTTTGTQGATEVTAKVARGTGYLVGDEKNASSAFLRSPYGVNSSCTVAG